MLHTINLNEYNLNKCKFIVIKNNTDVDFNFNNKIINPKQDIFKKLIERSESYSRDKHKEADEKSNRKRKAAKQTRTNASRTANAKSNRKTNARKQDVLNLFRCYCCYANYG